VAGRNRPWVWALSAAMAGLSFGYQVGAISGALLFIRRDFGLSGFEQGVLVGALPLGAMAGGLLTGRLGEALGRRRMLIVSALLFLAGTAIAVVAPGYALLLAGRAVVGVALGTSASTVPIYLSEIAPPDIRGRCVALNQVLMTSGIVASLCVDLIFAGSGSWRAMFAVGLVPAALLLVGMLRAPESPLWLARHKRAAAAQSGERVGLRELLRADARPALIIGVTLAAIQQLSGINAVIYFAPTILETTGLSASDSILYSVIVGVVNVAATIASVRLVDRAGRRPLLIASLVVMPVCLVLLGLTFVLDLKLAWLSLICILAYVGAFAVGLGPIFWVLIGEIFPPAARAEGAGIATSANWFWNFVVGVAFLPAVTAIGQGEAFWLFAAVCALALVFVNRYVPETKGRTLAEVDAEIRARWARAARPALMNAQRGAP
jgi:SP family galactose:H+ symporter-like MFS transporter